jgi:pyruvate dehydrogenase E2 component (dihydrolipoamide acetyltransferase)
MSPTGRLRAAPVARRAADDLGIVLEQIVGSGPRGRITLGDVQQAAREAAATPEPAPAEVEPPAAPAAAEPLSKLRRAIARRMTASQQIPQYQLQRDVDATHLLAQKEAMSAGTGPAPAPGINDLLMQAIAEMVVRHPALATSFIGEPEPAIIRRTNIGVGLAVATDRGLVVPVVEEVERAGLRSIAERRRRLVEAARKGTLTQEEMTGGVITLSNLSSFGVDRFAAMLNPGESSIVAVGRASDRVVPRGRGIAIVPTLAITMTFDHRTVDGAAGAAALAELAELVEGQMTWRP